MAVYQLNPVSDPRWADLVQRHPRASVFHTSAWLEALKRAYGYEPVAFTTSAPRSELQNGLVFCDVRSWLTGRRLVSLPFADHCEPLIEDTHQLAEICNYLEHSRVKKAWKYIELRPQSQTALSELSYAVSEQFCWHVLDLDRELNSLFRSFHKDCVQRKVRRAERENLTCHEGSGEELLRAFYRLVVLTRRRHGLPPQPFAWFRALAGCLRESMTIRIVSLDGRLVAGMLTLRHRDTIVYKYGASDSALHRLGGMPLLFWKTIQNARAHGCVALDLGRSDIENEGLVAFKDRWGAARSAMTYWRYPAAQPSPSVLRTYAVDRAKLVLGHLPDGCRLAAGRLLYKHVG